MNRILIVLSLLATAFVFTVGLSSCTDDDGDDATATLTIQTDQDPIAHTATDSSGRHFWYYTCTIEETSGVGVTLTKWTFEMFTNDGQKFASGSQSLSNFAAWFDDCDQTSGTIGPNGKVCAAALCASSPDQISGWYAIDTLTFIDDNDHEFTLTKRFNFAALQ